MTTNLQSTSLSSYLYNQDYCLWLETTAKLLRNHQLDHVDFEHLIEEIEDMGKEKRRELKNRLIVCNRSGGRKEIGKNSAQNLIN
jgi:hypothetical protein